MAETRFNSNFHSSLICSLLLIGARSTCLPPCSRCVHSNGVAGEGWPQTSLRSESVFHACMYTREILFKICWACVYFQRHTSSRVAVREEEAILKKDIQTETCSPVCSHNEWDPLEVKGEEEGRVYRDCRFI